MVFVIKWKSYNHKCSVPWHWWIIRNSGLVDTSYEMQVFILRTPLTLVVDTYPDLRTFSSMFFHTVSVYLCHCTEHLSQLSTVCFMLYASATPTCIFIYEQKTAKDLEKCSRWQGASACYIWVFLTSVWPSVAVVGIAICVKYFVNGVFVKA